MQPSAGKTILPIFKKKRPRQAIFTYPNNGTNANTGNDPQRNFQPANPPVQHPGYMQPQQPQRNQQSYASTQNFQNRNNVMPSTGRSFKGADPGTSASSQQPGFLGQTNYTRKQTNGRQQMMPKKNMTSMQKRQPQQQQLSSGQSYQPRYNQNQYGRSSSSTYGSEDSRSTVQQNNNQYRSNYNQNTSTTKRQYASPSAPNQSNHTGMPMGQFGVQNAVPPNKRIFTPSTNTQAMLLPFQGPGTEGKDDTATVPVATTALDKTLKMITSNIEGMKHWSQYTESLGLLMFEIFGILNSAISTDESGTAKLFSLKEGQHSQRCVFYETDRHLQRLTRGQLIRCVGNLEKKTSLFRVVTVRAVSKQEQVTYRAIIAKSDQMMNERLAEMQEQ